MTEILAAMGGAAGLAVIAGVVQIAITRWSKHRAAAAKAEERAEVREDTAQREVFAVLRDRVRILEEREDGCADRIERVLAEAKAERHAVRDTMQSALSECEDRASRLDERVRVLERLSHVGGE